MAEASALPAKILTGLEKLRKAINEKKYLQNVPGAEGFVNDLYQIEQEGSEELIFNKCKQFMENLTESVNKADENVRGLQKDIQQFLDIQRSRSGGQPSGSKADLSNTVNIPVAPYKGNKSSQPGGLPSGSKVAFSKPVNTQVRANQGDKSPSSAKRNLSPNQKSSTVLEIKKTPPESNVEEKGAMQLYPLLLDERNQELKELHEKRTQLEQKMQELQGKVNLLQAQLYEKQETVDKFEHEANEMYGRNTELEQERNNFIEQLQASLTELETYKKKTSYLEDHIKGLERKNAERVKALTAERDDLRNRYSKLAGQKLKDNNADISDLSDPNRPMKLAEKFSELYDNEWTDIFQAQVDTMKISEKEAIQFLLQILDKCYKFCKQVAENQKEQLRNIFLYHCQDVSKTVAAGKEGPRLSSREEKLMLENRKTIAASHSAPVKQSFVQEAIKGLDKKYEKVAKELNGYFEKCAEVCWLLAINDPPLFMDLEIKQGSKVDLNLYTFYYPLGDKADFLVWPPLYNVQKGGLINKGVIAPVPEKKKIKK